MTKSKAFLTPLQIQIHALGRNKASLSCSLSFHQSKMRLLSFHGFVSLMGPENNSSVLPQLDSTS